MEQIQPREGREDEGKVRLKPSLASVPIMTFIARVIAGLRRAEQRARETSPLMSVNVAFLTVHGL